MCPFSLEATWGGEDRGAVAHPLPLCAPASCFPSLHLDLHFSRRDGSAWLTSREEQRPRARCDSWGQLPAPSERTVFPLTAGWQAIAEKAAVHSHGCCPHSASSEVSMYFSSTYYVLPK